MSAADKLAVERNDLGRVLLTVFPTLGDRTPDQAVQHCITRDGKRFRKVVEKLRPIDIGGTELQFRGRDPVFVGGAGVVLKCVNRLVPAVALALKVPRPSLGTAGGAYRVSIQEYLKHAPLQHENIARIFQTALVRLWEPDPTQSPTHLPVLLMEWIDGATPLNDYLVSAASYTQVLAALRQAFQALAYLHSSHLIHWDIKSDNLLVSESGVVKLTDIGNARRTDIPFDDRGEANSTRGNLPPKIDPERHAAPGVTRRTPVAVPGPEWDSDWLDMWMLAREVNRVLGADQELLALDREAGRAPLEGDQSEALGRLFPDEDPHRSFVLSAIRLVLRRLLGPMEPSARGYYPAASDVDQQLARIQPEFGAAQEVDELHAIPQHVLRIPVAGNVPFTPRVARLYNQPFVQRLGHHLQLGTVFHVYPGASHRRVEHVAGVMGAAVAYVRALYADRRDPFWRLDVSAYDVSALIVAALLHDIGHVALGHYLEELKGLMRGRTHENYLLAVLDPARGEPNGDLARSADVTEDRRQLLGCLRRDWVAEGDDVEGFAAYVGQIISPSHANSPVSDGRGCLTQESSALLKVEILHSIIDSAIDADKLDYLRRDALHAGVTYTEGIDVDRFFQSLTAVAHIPESVAKRSVQVGRRVRACIAVNQKGLLPVESMLIGRYQMFSCVYWQHTARAETAMLQYAIQAIVASTRSAARAGALLDKILFNFRRVDDGDAIRWLAELVHEPALHLPASTKARIGAICSALLGDRGTLYWRAFELGYEPKPQGTAMKIAAAMAQVSADWAQEPDILSYVRAVAGFRKRAARLIAQELAMPLFKDGEVLFDVPPAGKDQIHNVFVLDDGEVKHVQDCSPVANAVRGAFEHWVRKIRVFMAPSAWERIGGTGISEDTVWNACWAALSDQQELFPLADTPRNAKARRR